MRLEMLRAQVARTDASLVDLLAERVRLAREIGIAKLERGLPIRDPAVERDVRDRLRALAATHDLPDAVANPLAEALVNAAIIGQERDRAAAYQGEQRRIHIIGGKGRMGGWFGTYFLQMGHEVSISDLAVGPSRFVETDLASGVLAADVVLIAAPISACSDLLSEVLALEPPGVVADIASLKTPLQDVLLAAAKDGARVASMHPLFGPDLQMLSGSRLLLLDCGSPVALAQLEALFEDTSLEVVRARLEDHDRLMADSLGLVHALNLLAFMTLVRSGVPSAELERFSSTTYRKQLQTTREVALENPYLYHEIQALNPASPDLYRRLNEALVELEAAALAKDPDAFIDLMAEGRRFFTAAETEGGSE